MMILIAIALIIVGLIAVFFGSVACVDAEGRCGSYAWLILAGAIVALLAACWLICIFVRWLP